MAVLDDGPMPYPRAYSMRSVATYSMLHHVNPTESYSGVRMVSSVAGVVDVVRLCRGEQDAVDALAEDAAEPAIGAGPEALQHGGHGAFEIGKGRRTGIQGRQHVHEHDLPVEPGEMIAEKRPDHMRLIGLVAARHHRREAAGDLGIRILDLQRCESQRRRAFEVARHQKAPGRQSR